jgi:hypothetical protein
MSGNPVSQDLASNGSLGACKRAVLRKAFLNDDFSGDLRPVMLSNSFARGLIEAQHE